MAKLIRQNVFIAFCAVIQTLGSLLLFAKGSFELKDGLLALSAGLAVFVAYQVLRSSQRFSLIVVISIALAAISALYFADASWQVYLNYGLSGLFTIGYGIHQFFPMYSQFSLRKNAWVKLVTIGLCWVSISTIAPVMHVSAWSSSSLVFVLAQFFFVVMLCIPFDFYDAQLQQSNGFETLPGLLGRPLTIKISRMIAVLAWMFAGFYHIAFFYAMSVSVICFLFALQIDKTTWVFEKYSLVFDGLMILQMLLLLVFMLVG